MREELEMCPICYGDMTVREWDLYSMCYNCARDMAGSGPPPVAPTEKPKQRSFLDYCALETLVDEDRPY